MAFSPLEVFFEGVTEKENPKGRDKKGDYYCSSTNKNNYAKVYHSSASKNLNIRTLLQNNSGTNFELATKFNISCQTVSK